MIRNQMGNDRAPHNMAPAQIHTGAFANVQVIRRGRQVVEISIDVVTPSGG